MIRSKLKNIKYSDIAVAVIILVLVIHELIFSKRIVSYFGKTEGELLNMLISRALGGAAFLFLTLSCNYRVFFIKASHVLYGIPAMIVALNNFPILSILLGNAVVDAEIGKILLLFFECMAVGFFEEMAFRAFVLLSVMEKRRRSRADIFKSVIISSVIFAVIHLVNIITSSPAAVIMQIGYSFLIGAMCSVVLLYTHSIFYCIVIHGLFNFMGAIVPTYGHGLIIWDHVPTMILTAVVGIICAVFYIVSFMRYDVSDTDGFYKKLR